MYANSYKYISTKDDQWMVSKKSSGYQKQIDVLLKNWKHNILIR